VPCSITVPAGSPRQRREPRRHTRFSSDSLAERPASSRHPAGATRWETAPRVLMKGDGRAARYHALAGREASDPARSHHRGVIASAL
jgi:hypothetical protein